MPHLDGETRPTFHDYSEYSDKGGGVDYADIRGVDYAQPGAADLGEADYGGDRGAADYTAVEEEKLLGSNYIACGTIGPCIRPRPTCSEAAPGVILFECVSTTSPRGG